MLKLFRSQKSRSPETSLEAWLGSKDAAKQQLADETLQEMGGEAAIGVLLNMNSVEVQKRRRRKRWFSIAYWLIAPFTYPLSYAMINVSNPFIFTILFLSIIFFTSVTNRVSEYFSRPSKLERNLIRHLSNSRDIRAIPALVEFARTHLNLEKDAIIHGLIEQLPLLTNETPSILPTRRWADVLFDREDRSVGQSSSILTTRQWYFLASLIPTKLAGFKIPMIVQQQLIEAIIAALATTKPSVSVLRKVKFLASIKTNNADEEQLRQTALKYFPVLEQAASKPKIAVRR